MARRLQSELKGIGLKVAAPMFVRIASPVAGSVAEDFPRRAPASIEIDPRPQRPPRRSRQRGTLTWRYALAKLAVELRHFDRAAAGALPPCGLREPRLFAGAWQKPRSPEELEDDRRHDCLLYRNRTISNEWRFSHRRRVVAKPPGARATRLGASNNGDVLRGRRDRRDRPRRVAGRVHRQRGAPARRDLKAVLCDFELDDPAIHAVWPPNRELSAKVRAFVDFLSERFGGTPYCDAALPETSRALID